VGAFWIGSLVKFVCLIANIIHANAVGLLCFVIKKENKCILFAVTVVAYTARYYLENYCLRSAVRNSR